MEEKGEPPPDEGKKTVTLTGRLRRRPRRAVGPERLALWSIPGRRTTKWSYVVLAWRSMESAVATPGLMP